MSNILDCNLAFLVWHKWSLQKNFSPDYDFNMQGKILVSFAINFINVCNEEPSAGDLES